MADLISVTTAKIGKEDLDIQDSTSTTFSRATSTGGTQNITSLGIHTWTSDSVFNVKEYGATGDGSTDDNTAFQAAVTAAVAAGGTILIPPGTYKISDPIDLSAPTGNHVNIVGIGQPTILKTDLTSPILLPGVGSTFEGFTLRFSTRPGASNLRAVGIQLGGGVDRDDSSAYVSHCAFRDINIYQTFIGILCGPCVEAGEASSLVGLAFANSWDNILIRDFYQSALILDIGPSGNDTGEFFSNFQIKNVQWDSSTQVNGAGSVIYTRNVLQAQFYNTHIDNIGDEDTPATAPEPILNLGSTATTAVTSVTFDGLHVENTYYAGADKNIIELGANTNLRLRNLNWNGNTVAAGSSNFINLVAFTANNSTVDIDGFSLNGNNATTGTFRQSWTNGASRTGCSMSIKGYAPSSADTSIFSINTAGDSVSDGVPILKQYGDQEYYTETLAQGIFTPYPHGELTIASGVITLNGDEMFVDIDTESDASSDILDAIADTNADGTTPSDGQILILRIANSSREVLVRPAVTTASAARFDLQGQVPCLLDSVDDRLVVQYNSSDNRWLEIGRRVGSSYDRLQFRNNSALTVSTNTIAPTAGRHLIDNSGGTQTITTITAPSVTFGGAASDRVYDDGFVLILRNNTAGNTVTYNETGNIILSGSSFSADAISDTIMLIYDYTLNKWLQIGGSNNA